MGYSGSEHDVRVDCFKNRGSKWYYSFAVSMKDLWDTKNIHAALIEAIRRDDKNSIQEECLYICLEPYHKNSHPITIMGWELQQYNW